MTEKSLKKIIIFYPHIGEYGGIERNIVALASQICQMGYTPVLVCYYDHIDMAKYQKKLHIVKLADSPNLLIKAYRLRKWYNKHSSEIQEKPFFFGSKAGFYAAIAGIKSYVLHYTDPPSLLSSEKESSYLKNVILAPKRYFSSWITAEGVRKADSCLTMTQWNAKELRSIYGRLFDVIYQGGTAPDKIINNSLRSSGSTLRIFSICRLTASKNLDWIIEAAHSIHTQYPFNDWFKKIEVVIGGKGPQINQLKQKTKSLGLEDLISFPGFLNADQLEEEYAKADVFLVPGKQGYGLPVLEALYRHLPVVINRESRVSEILEQNPWVAISDDSSESFKETLVHHIIRIRKEYPNPKYLKNLPTEQNWANEIGKYCQWW